MSIYVSWRKRLVALGLALWLIVGLLGSAPWASFGQGPPSPEVVSEAPRTPSLAPTPTGAAPQHGRGYVPPPVDLSHLDGRWRPGPQLAQLPGSWDWRAEGKVTGVQDQGDCGSCYAFATLATLESQLLIAGEGTYDLSEMHAAHCNYENYENGCSGGNIWMVTNLYSAQGAVLESCDPYTFDDETCHTTCPPVKTVTDMWVLAGPSIPPTETLKSWLHNYGPLYVAMDSGGNDPLGWGSEFGAYKEGSDTLYEPMDEPNLDHAVLLVGWDDTLEHAGDFDGGWIVKNSWGTGWGGTCGYGSEKGYFTIAYGSAGIGSSASLIKGWQDYDPDGSLLYLDEAGMQGFFGYGTTVAWGLARLTPGEDGCATQVEIWTSDAATVTLSIYDDFDGDAPSGPLWSSEDKTFDHAGYHSIPVQRRVPLSAGDDVNVMVRVENAAYTYTVSIDSIGPVSETQSFASATGQDGSWVDLALGTPVDIGIRLRVAPCGERNIYLPVVLKEWAPATPP